MGENIPLCPTAHFLDLSRHNYQLPGSFTVATQDAKEYLYSISKTRRVHRFQSFKVNLYI